MSALLEGLFGIDERQKAIRDVKSEAAHIDREVASPVKNDFENPRNNHKVLVSEGGGYKKEETNICGFIPDENYFSAMKTAKDFSDPKPVVEEPVVEDAVQKKWNEMRRTKAIPVVPSRGK